MTVVLIGILGVITYVSRALGLVVVPEARGRVRAVFDRLPAGLFAGLAVIGLLDENGGLRSPATLVAAACALLVAPTRSLPLVFVAGAAGYAAVRYGLGI